MRNYSVCPANVFGRVRGAAPVEDLTEAVCTAEPSRCWTSCTEGRNGTACFRLARVFQERGPQGDPRSQILFAMACARGMAAGCTNRAAGVRNGKYDEDPLRKLSEAKREACTARSFAVACRQEDSWGCFMHGQAAANGEGIPRDVALARKSYAKACTATGGRDVAGCASAKEALEGLNRRR
jgi:TPR repeat protein